MNKANARKKGNKKKQARHARCWANADERKRARYAAQLALPRRDRKDDEPKYKAPPVVRGYSAPKK